MIKGIFAYILRYSKRQQIALMLMTLASLPFYYLSLDLPKTIINEAIDSVNFPIVAEIEILGFPLYFGTYNQIPYLLLLCLAFLTLVLINGGFKLVINIYRGVLGERMLRRLRLQLVNRIMEFPLTRFRRTSQGELVSMVNQETEPLGGFFGEAISLPLYQGGMLITILLFMFVQDWRLGLASIALYPIQGWLIPKLQRRINELNKKRTLRLRKLSEKLGELVAGINEVHVNNNRTYYDDQFSTELGGIFFVRIQIYKLKFFIKFLNNSFAQITPFFFFLIGGVLVIRGDLSIGALVAALAAYKDLSPPWKELLSWYQGQADARQRYAILIEQFLDDDSAQAHTASAIKQNTKLQPALPAVASGVSFASDNGVNEFDSISLSVQNCEWIALVGTGTSGKSALAQLFARLIEPTAGRLLFAGTDSKHLARESTASSVAYSGYDSYLFSGTILENLLLGLKQAPRNPKLVYGGENEQYVGAVKRTKWQREAELSGNSVFASDADWIDYSRAGVKDKAELKARIGTTLRTVCVAKDIVESALTQTVNMQEQPDFAKNIVAARQLFKEEVMRQDLDSVVEFLDPDKYNNSATLAENILFGASELEEFSAEGLSNHPLLQKLLADYKLTQTFDDIAMNSATTLCELFSDLPPDHEFFNRYDLINADDLNELNRILRLLSKDNALTISGLREKDRTLIRAISFRLVSDRHRLGALGKEEKKRVVMLRKDFANKLDKQARDKIEFFSSEHYNEFKSISENIIFGRIVYGRLGANKKIRGIILDVLEKMNLMSSIYDIGLSAQIGLGGSLISQPQRQKLALARGLIKRPELLVINDGLSAVDTEEISTILTNIKNDLPELTLLWVDNRTRFTHLFDRFAHLQAGKLTRIEDSSTDNEANIEPVKRLPATTSTSDDMSRKLKFLYQIPLFETMDKHQLHLLASGCEAISLEKGDRLFQQGDIGDSLYIVVEGNAGVYVSTAVDSQQPQKVEEIGINEVIGELALLSNTPRSATVKAITHLTLLKLERSVFLDIVRSNGEIGYQILQLVTNRFSTPANGTSKIY